MLYKTMVLELLQQRPAMHNQLRASRTLLPTLNRLAEELKASHEAWKSRLRATMPGTSEDQITNEALELALNDLVDSLPPA